MYNILITAPSLNENENVSGISSVVRTIVNNDANNHYFHFRLGKKDGEKKGFLWLVNQLIIPVTLMRFIVKNNINIVHLNTGLEKPSIVRDFFVLYVSKFICRKKIIFHIHGGYFLMNPPVRGSLMFFMISRMIRHADKSLVLSDIEKQIIDNTYLTDAMILPNSVDVKDFAPRTSSGFCNKLNMIFLGRIVSSKGVFLIADALSKMEAYYQDFHLNIYGAGPDLDRLLQQLNAAQGLPYTYHGVTRGDGKYQALSNSQLFLLPSVHSEGLPIALLEAMSAGCICVVSDDASMSTVIENNVSGIMIKKGSAADLYNALLNVFTNRQALMDISARAMEQIKKHFSSKEYIIKLNNIYKAI